MAFTKSTGNDKPSRKLAPPASGMGGPSGNSAKLKHVSAPAKPKMASMKSAHGKLVKGDC